MRCLHPILASCHIFEGQFISQGCQPRGALSTSTYREVSPIFLGQNIVKSDIFASK